ncbi:HAD family hydrolase [Anatilimnocola floriformis]|uniref:HAD family hydrolase n=1 Tax=Anatilimnocola floriformis TaxID=2948575 RepID=UPI0020C330CE|nr:HAD family hydrolase [Anatilimnocola floriformis]
MVRRPSPDLELLRADIPKSGYRAVVFDFDGTLSLLRRNWQGIMVPMMVDHLSRLDTGEPQNSLKKLVEQFVIELTGQPTMVQMQRLAAEIRQRGHMPQAADVYFQQYQDSLMLQTNARIRAVTRGHASPDMMAVAGTRRMLDELQLRKIHLVLASGTELKDVKNELQVLDFHTYFEPRVHCPVDQDPKFSKLAVMQQLVKQGYSARSIIAIGDGPTEILAIKQLGGLAIGLASNEVTGTGVDPLKREHLIRAGADIIIGDYRCWQELFQRLGFADMV